VLFTPDRHEPLTDATWDAARARDGIAAIVSAADADYDPATGTWPLHPNDRIPGADGPHRSMYSGAAGVIWALDQLATYRADGARDYGPRTETLYEELVRQPDEPDWPEDNGYLGGRLGALALAQRHRDDPARAELMLELIAGFAEHRARELLYGSPGALVLAAAEHARTGDVRFRDVQRPLIPYLLATWEPDGELGVRLWTQHMRPEWSDRYVGFGHGFAGNVFALLRSDVLTAEERRGVERDAIATATRLAVVDSGDANWPALVGEPLETKSGIRTQWCHGAAGVVVALGGLGPDDDEWSALLLGGGRVTWDAGPLRDRAGLCHGTAGNAYAFLQLFARTGDEVWLERARRFALHALAQVEREPEPWHSLFTGDLGAALALQSCLDADPRFPALGVI
jgi:hypothetical protein